MQVFISHSHSDSSLAARVSESLRKAGLDVWNHDLDVLPGDNWAAEVARALNESEAMVVLVTPEALRSPYVRREIGFALGSQNYDNRLIPVAIGDREQLPTREIPWIVRRLPWVELSKSEGGDVEVEPIANAIRNLP